MASLEIIPIKKKKFYAVIIPFSYICYQKGFFLSIFMVNVFHSLFVMSVIIKHLKYYRIVSFNSDLDI